MRKKAGLLIPAAAVFMAAAFPMPSPAEEFVPGPGQVYDDATWARIQDNVLEYDEISMLIDTYNSTMKNMRETYQDSKDSYKSVDRIKESMMESSGTLLDNSQMLQDQAEQVKNMLGVSGSMASSYAGMVYSSELLNAQAEQMLLSVDSLTETTPDMMKLRIVETTRAGLISGAQSAVIGYEQLLLQKENLEESIALLEEVYASVQTQQNVGMATAEDVLTARQNLESAQAGLLTIDASTDKIRQSLCTMLGWPYDGNPEIRNVPSADLTRIEGMDPRNDLTAATDNNFTLRYNLLDYENKTDGSVEKQNLERTIENQKAQIASSLTNLYNDVIQKKNEYETAVTAYDLEKKKMDTAETKYGLGMIGRLEYLQQKNALLSKEISMKNADLALFQAMETYDWAVQGNLSLS